MADNFEEVDKETLIGLLKDKGKELKVTEARLKKLEEKYPKVYKENKNLKVDRETFESFFKKVFEENQEKFQNVEFGDYDV
mmetsp:Transcript_35314/g.31763  ORF Transcript_35314/g.31763 Transcript_35314/m.31763 type:complete len:81 (-) Transcript_35314:1134-1376(-)